MAINIISKVYRGASYYAQELSWSIRSREAYEDQIRYALSRLGISSVYLNKYLDKKGTPKEIGRFPELFKGRRELRDIVVSESENLFNPPHRDVFSLDEKREFIAIEIVEKLERERIRF